MTAYVVVDIEIIDFERYEEYKKMAPDPIAAYGGKYLARGGALEVLEGEHTPQRVVILEFESIERAKQWWDSPEYREARELRHATARSTMLVVEGL